MFTATGMKVSGWVKLRYEGNVYEDLRELIKWYLVKKINEEYAKFMRKVVGMGTRTNIYSYSRLEVRFEEKVGKVLEENCFPGLFT